jgi:predicted TPR repeat methyltransferase
VKADKRNLKEFVAEFFDSFAGTFDFKLGALGYRLPGLVGEAAAFISPSSYSLALDTACGTGFSRSILASSR